MSTTPLEVFGAVGAVVGLSGACLKLLEKARESLAYGKGITETLEVTCTDVENTRSIVHYIAEAKPLQLPEITPPLRAMQDAAKSLDTYLTELVQKTEDGGGFRTFARSLLHGPAEQSKLHQLKETLLQAKTTLIIAIQTAPVGVLKDSHNSIVVNLRVVDTVNQWLTQLPGNENGGLVLNNYLMTKRVKYRGEYIKLSGDEIAEVIGPSQEPGVKEALAAIPSLEILDNTTGEFGAMYNARIGNGTADPWAVADPEPMRIARNTANGCSIMANNHLSRHDANNLTKTQTERFEKALNSGKIDKIINVNRGMK